MNTNVLYSFHQKVRYISHPPWAHFTHPDRQCEDMTVSMKKSNYPTATMLRRNSNPWDGPPWDLPAKHPLPYSTPSDRPVSKGAR